ncbi:MAG: preprotein translocase subunit YajC [Mycetocola sp.]
MDIMQYAMLAILAVLIFFMFRNGQKRKRDLAALRATIVPGATVMTNFGLFGTVESINEEENRTQLEIAPGVVVGVHSQAIARVVDEQVPADDIIGTPAEAIDAAPETDDNDKKN